MPSYLDVPKDCSAKIDVVLHESHTRISRPALLVVIADYVLVVRIRVLSEVALDEISRLLGVEPKEENVSEIADHQDSRHT